jgi:hypothetical protein
MNCGERNTATSVVTVAAVVTMMNEPLFGAA